MAVYFITGKLGGGKTLCTVSKIQEYLRAGRKVATNIDLFLEHMTNNWDKTADVVRVPDEPSVTDLDLIGEGYSGEYRGEESNGLLALDECGTWFNARDWNKPGRKEIINWVVHARKLRWDIAFLVQDITVVDKQAQIMFAEHVVYCRRTDRLAVPIIGTLYKFLFDKRLSPPKAHVAVVRYGAESRATVVDRWITRGTDLYAAYDTEQKFLPDSGGARCLLPAFTLVGYKQSRKELFIASLRNFKAKSRTFFV